MQLYPRHMAASISLKVRIQQPLLHPQQTFNCSADPRLNIQMLELQEFGRAHTQATHISKVDTQKPHGWLTNYVCINAILYRKEFPFI